MSNQSIHVTADDLCACLPFRGGSSGGNNGRGGNVSPMVLALFFLLLSAPLRGTIFVAEMPLGNFDSFSGVGISTLDVASGSCGCRLTLVERFKLENSCFVLPTFP